MICVAGLVHQQFPLDSGAPKRPYQNYFVGQCVYLLLDVYSSMPLLALTKPSECILPSGLAKAAESHVRSVPLSRASAELTSCRKWKSKRFPTNELCWCIWSPSFNCWIQTWLSYVMNAFWENPVLICRSFLLQGHDMRMFGLELFLSRCQKLKVGLTASKICRLHRTFDGKTKVGVKARIHSITNDEWLV